MKLFHSSPTKIEKITNSGMFGTFLFFSSEKDVHGNPGSFDYNIEIDEEKIIEASHIFYEETDINLTELISEVCEIAEVDEDTAMGLIDETENIWDIDSGIDNEDKAEISWEIQAITAQIAKKLGYDGVAVSDEHGVSYMIDMLGREKDLTGDNQSTEE